MRHFATLALAATLLAPAALAQTAGLTPGPSVDQPYFHTLDLANSGQAAFPLNSSQDLDGGVVACASSAEGDDGERIPLGTTDNSFYRAVDISKFALPPDPELTSIDFGVNISYFDDATTTAVGTIIVSTLPAGADFEGGFSRGDLSELASASLEFATDSLFLANTGFDDPANPFDGAPALTGDEILVIELSFPDGSSTDEDPPQFDARAAGNTEDADGVLYLSSDACGIDDATPALDLGATFDDVWVVTLNINTIGEGGGAVTIGEGRAAGVGETVTVAGTVTRAAGDFVYIQDETGGLTIRQTEGDFFDGVADGSIAPGTTVEVTGTLSEFRGLLQINEADLAEFTVTGTGDVPDAQTVTLAEIAAGGEDFEGELVTVTGVTLTTTDTEFQARTNYDVTDASDMTGAVVVRVPNADDGDVDGTTIPGGTLTITGIVGQFDSEEPLTEGYQILVINDGDVTGNPTSIGEDPEGRLSLGTVAPNPSAARASVTVTLQEAGHATLEVYDLLGRQVATVLDRALSAGTASVDLEVGAFPAGTYMVRLSANGATVVRPFTVAR